VNLLLNAKAYLRAVAEVDFDADYAMLNEIFATDCALARAATVRQSASAR
jgi:hypothetical protein